MLHLKDNDIFGIPEPKANEEMVKHFFNFWPPYNAFWSPLFHIAKCCQHGISVFLCQDMWKSKKRQKKLQLCGTFRSTYMYMASTMIGWSMILKLWKLIERDLSVIQWSGLSNQTLDVQKKRYSVGPRYWNASVRQFWNTSVYQYC